MAVAGSSPLTVAGSASFLRTSQLSRNIRAPETVAAVTAGHSARRSLELRQGLWRFRHAFPGHQTRIRRYSDLFLSTFFYPTCLMASRVLRGVRNIRILFLSFYALVSFDIQWVGHFQKIFLSCHDSATRAIGILPADRVSPPHPLVISYIRRRLLSRVPWQHTEKFLFEP